MIHGDSVSQAEGTTCPKSVAGGRTRAAGKGELREGVRARSESLMAQREDFGFYSDKRSLRQFWQSAVCLQTLLVVCFSEQGL